jgi:hypothetical protein
MKPALLCLLVAAAFLSKSSLSAAQENPRMSLAGSWAIRLDSGDEGLAAGWPGEPLRTEQRINLPSTTDLAGLGFALDTNAMLHLTNFPQTTRFPGVKDPRRADEHGYLVRRHLFVGPAWYERDLVVPDGWKGKQLHMQIERAMWKTEVWVDGQSKGTCDSLVAPHRFELGKLAPGRHRLTVRVDNRMVHNISTVTHAYGPETQSRWNGMVGDISIEAVESVSIKSIAVYPAPDRKSVRLSITIRNASADTGGVHLAARLLVGTATNVIAGNASDTRCEPGETDHSLSILLQQAAEPWDEFSPALYHVQVVLAASSGVESKASATFGFRQVERSDRGLRLNGRRLFLRGTLDCCVYPGTGHPPESVAEWSRILGIVKDYGFNHVRFHTWCPSAAAFEAADHLGVYLEPETPAWVDDWGVNTVTRPLGIGRDSEVFAYLKTEMRRMAEAYGNHPSFLMLTMGNEFGERSTDWGAVDAAMVEMKRLDPRRLYSGCTARRHLPSDDYWITHSTGSATRGVGPAHTDWDFSKAVMASPVPVLSHETGQRPVFPDYEELLPKFTGPLLPLNLERYRLKLVESGLASQARQFLQASAHFQLVQYKAEHEAMLRTAGLAGYQLLMLNDFTGQSEALVGVLDPFWESKGIVTERDVRSWNSPTTVLARFSKFVWNNQETLQVRFEAAQFGPADIAAGKLEWSLAAWEGRVVASGTKDRIATPTGTVSPLDAVTIALTELKEPASLVLKAKFGHSENQWNLWAYPLSTPEPEPSGFLVCKRLDDEAQGVLRDGGKVLLLAHGLKNPCAAGARFESVYWSAGWWGNKFSSLGILCDPKHPALAGFPNAGWSDWQWHDLLRGATTIHLQGAPKSFRPIVQAVPDFHYPALLAHVFEAKVGAGSLMVCGFDLQSNLDRRIAARQFRQSLYRYLASPAFSPAQTLPPDLIGQLLSPAGLQGRGAKAKADSEDVANGNVAANAIDGDPSTFWHTQWQPSVHPMPHELVIDLGQERQLKGFRYHPRIDQANGRIAEAQIYGALTSPVWGEPLATVHWPNSDAVQEVRFAKSISARYLRVLIQSEVTGQPFASIAELNIIE